MPLDETRAPLRVAVVDDDEAFRNSLALLLRAAGYHPETHRSAAAFVAGGGIGRVHCLVLDVMMPDIDGFALQTFLRRANSDVPIIFCTGATSEEIRETAVANGAAGFLTKPFKAKELIDAIQSTLTRLTPINRPS